MDFPWQPKELYDNLLKWFNILRLSYISSEISNDMVLAFIFIFGGFVIVCWILVILGARYAYYGYIPNIIASSLKAIMPIYSTLIYLQIFEITMSLFQCESITDESKYVAITRDLQRKTYCWETEHTIFAGVFSSDGCLDVSVGLCTQGFDLTACN